MTKTMINQTLSNAIEAARDYLMSDFFNTEGWVKFDLNDITIVTSMRSGQRISFMMTDGIEIFYTESYSAAFSALVYALS